MDFWNLEKYLNLTFVWTCKIILAVFSDPERFNQATIPVASQKLVVEDALDQLRAASGKQIRSVYRSDEESIKLMDSIPIIKGQLFQRNTTGDKVGIEEVKGWGVRLGTFDEFLSREKAWVDQTFATVP